MPISWLPRINRLRSELALEQERLWNLENPPEPPYPPTGFEPDELTARWVPSPESWMAARRQRFAEVNQPPRSLNVARERFGQLPGAFGEALVTPFEWWGALQTTPFRPQPEGADIFSWLPSGNQLEPSPQVQAYREWEKPQFGVGGAPVFNPKQQQEFSQKLTAFRAGKVTPQDFTKYLNSSMSERHIGADVIAENITPFEWGLLVKYGLQGVRLGLKGAKAAGREIAPVARELAVGEAGFVRLPEGKFKLEPGETKEAVSPLPGQAELAKAEPEIMGAIKGTKEVKFEITEKDVQRWLAWGDNSRPVATAIAKLDAMGLLEYVEGHSKPGGIMPFSIKYKDPATGTSKFLVRPTNIKEVVDDLWNKHVKQAAKPPQEVVTPTEAAAIKAEVPIAKAEPPIPPKPPKPPKEPPELGGLMSKPDESPLPSGQKSTFQKFKDFYTEKIMGISKREPVTVVESPLVNKLKLWLNASKTARTRTNILRHAERGERAKLASEALEVGKGHEAFVLAKSTLAGEYSRAGISAESLADLPKFTPEDVTELLETIRTTDKLQTFQKIRAEEAWQDIFTISEGGIANVPIPYDLKQLGKVIGDDTVNMLLETKRSLGAKIWRNFVEVSNLPLATATSIDISGLGRQGAPILGRHPRLIPGAFKNSIKAFLNDKNADDIMKIIYDDPDFATMIERMGMKGDFRPLPSEVVRGSLTQLEEAYVSQALTKYVPGLRHSNRAYVAALNWLTYKNAKALIPALDNAEKIAVDNLQKAVQAGVDGRLIIKAERNVQQAQEAWKAAGFLTSVASGRGRLGPFQSATPLLSIIFWAPRWVASQLELPAMLFSKHPIIRKEAARMIVQTYGPVIGLLSAGKATGLWDVELDRRSTDFGKLRVGNIRIDLSRGYVQYIRFISQMISGQRKTVAGKIVKANRARTLQRMAQSKSAPFSGLMLDVAAGENYIGEPLNWDMETVQREAYRRLSPFAIQDLQEAIELDGVLGIIGASSFLGASVQSYKPPKRKYFLPKRRFKR